MFFIPFRLDLQGCNNNLPRDVAMNTIIQDQFEDFIQTFDEKNAQHQQRIQSCEKLLCEGQLEFTQLLQRLHGITAKNENLFSFIKFAFTFFLLTESIFIRCPRLYILQRLIYSVKNVHNGVLVGLCTFLQSMSAGGGKQFFKEPFFSQNGKSMTQHHALFLESRLSYHQHGWDQVQNCL